MIGCGMLIESFLVAGVSIIIAEGKIASSTLALGE